MRIANQGRGPMTAYQMERVNLFLERVADKLLDMRKQWESHSVQSAILAIDRQVKDADLRSQVERILKPVLARERDGMPYRTPAERRDMVLANKLVYAKHPALLGSRYD